MEDNNIVIGSFCSTAEKDTYVYPKEIPGYVTDYLTRLDINQEKRVYQYNPDKDLLEDCSCVTLPCGHAVNFARYSSSGTCYICDMKLAFGL